MRINRFLSLTDIIVAVVVFLAIFLPRRPIQAVDAYTLDADARAELAAAEARWQLAPDDGELAAELSRRLTEARMLDWAVEVAASTATRAPDATRWRALRATSEAFAERVEVQAAFDWARRALDACHQAGTACPTWEELKMDLYVRYLDAGVKSGIDPRKEPGKFREATNDALRAVDIRGVTPGVPRDDAPPPGTGGGAGTGTGTGAAE